jgi:hypothetical protein
MENKLKVSLLFASVFLSVGVSANIASEWHIENMSKSTGYVVDGAASGHQFGLVKHSNTCGNDEVYLSWSSNSSDIWSLAGKTITMNANFNGVSIPMPLEVVAIKPLKGNSHQVIMGHVFANSELLDLMHQAHSVEVLMPTSGDALRHFSVGGDSFILRGFTEARSQAFNRCQTQSS